MWIISQGGCRYYASREHLDCEWEYLWRDGTVNEFAYGPGAGRNLSTAPNSAYCDTIEECIALVVARGEPYHVE